MEQGRAASAWPTLKEYDEALLKRMRTVQDRDIQYGELAKDLTGPIRLNGGGGKYVCVYKVGNWAVRCFTGYPPSDIGERYAEISAYMLRYQMELPFLVGHTWIKEGITINGRKWPLLKVRFLSNCLPLGEFLGGYQGADLQVRARVLADKWLEILKKLEEKRIAHGDLDVSNVLVEGKAPQELKMHLIDFDGMYVPAFEKRAYEVADLGHEHFQPYKQGVRHFNHEMDRFSGLVIYLSLIALAENPKLWEDCDADESNRLLLGSDDFQRPAYSHNVVLLHQQSRNSRLQVALHELLRSIEHSCMPGSFNALFLSTPAPISPVREPEALPPPVPGGPPIPIPIPTRTPVPVPPNLPVPSTINGGRIALLVGMGLLILIVLVIVLSQPH